MIKRRFYKVDRKDVNFDSSSSDSSGSTEEERKEEERSSGEEEVERNPSSSSPSSLSSGYESEDSSGNEIKCDSSGLLFDEVEDNAGNNRQGFKNRQSVPEGNLEGTRKKKPKDTAEIDGFINAEVDKYILSCKSVFKCRICPRIVCLNEESLVAHLKSKRHARSKKLLEEGRLKQMLNSDGEIEEEAETHAERLSRTLALAQKSATPKKNKGRQRQRKRRAEMLRAAPWLLLAAYIAFAYLGSKNRKECLVEKGAKQIIHQPQSQPTRSIRLGDIIRKQDLRQ